MEEVSIPWVSLSVVFTGNDNFNFFQISEQFFHIWKMAPYVFCKECNKDVTCTIFEYSGLRTFESFTLYGAASMRKKQHTIMLDNVRPQIMHDSVKQFSYYGEVLFLQDLTI